MENYSYGKSLLVCPSGVYPVEGSAVTQVKLVLPKSK